MLPPNAKTWLELVLNQAAIEKPAKKRVKTRRRTVKKSARGPEWTFPKNTLEDPIRVARAIEDENAGKPMRADMLVKAVGYHQITDWRFRDLRKAANMYGLTDGTPSSTVSLRPVGQDMVAPSTAAQRQKALLEAFSSVEPFKSVERTTPARRSLMMNILRTH
ncbi:MAG: hypothetical protein ABW061_14450 [Polyangiaceae bacterium]